MSINLCLGLPSCSSPQVVYTNRDIGSSKVPAALRPCLVTWASRGQTHISRSPTSQRLSDLEQHPNSDSHQPKKHSATQLRATFLHLFSSMWNMFIQLYLNEVVLHEMLKLCLKQAHENHRKVWKLQRRIHCKCILWDYFISDELMIYYSQ
jgi:hypothetical protein